MLNLNDCKSLSKEIYRYVNVLRSPLQKDFLKTITIRWVMDVKEL